MRNLLDQISASVEWVVAFRLTAVTQCATGGLAPELVFLLEPGARRPSDEFVVLTARGRYLAEADCRLRPGDHVTPALAPLVGDSVAHRYAPLLDSLPVGQADCVGVGALDGAEPVAMAVKIVDGLGAATAVFARAPTRCHYELLPAVGVRCQSVQTANGQTVVRFENRLPEHLLAGLVSGFARTHHCNLFFLRHGAIDAELEQGLLAAGEARLKLAVRVLQATAVRAGLDARAGGRAMTCLPPPPQAPFPYGDLVPLGLLLRALRRFPEDKAVDAGAQLVRRHLDRQRQGLLWSFHTGGLATATDTSLVLLGHGDPAAIQDLGRFADADGGILPQLSDEQGTPGRMRASPANAHWRQADFGTTCLVRWLRREAGLPYGVPLATLAARMDARSALFFANPYLVDWCLAEAVRDDPDAAAIRARLADEIAAGANEDFSFGSYDQAMSTALAILALAALGRRGRLLRAAQLRLLREVDGAEPAAPATPFYYTFVVAGAQDGRLPMPVQGRIAVAGELHDLHLLEDTYRIVTTAVVLMALAEPCDPAMLDLPSADRSPHGRYACRSAADYVRAYALPPYVGLTHG